MTANDEHEVGGFPSRGTLLLTGCTALIIGVVGLARGLFAIGVVAILLGIGQLYWASRRV
jgi:hypothetical protein